MTTYYIDSNGPQPQAIVNAMNWISAKAMAQAILYIPIKKNVDNYSQYLNGAFLASLKKHGKAIVGGVEYHLGTKSTIRSMQQGLSVIALHCSDADLGMIVGICQSRDVIWVPWSTSELQRAQKTHSMILVP